MGEIKATAFARERESSYWRIVFHLKAKKGYSSEIFKESVAFGREEIRYSLLSLHCLYETPFSVLPPRVFATFNERISARKRCWRRTKVHPFDERCNLKITSQFQLNEGKHHLEYAAIRRLTNRIWRDSTIKWWGFLPMSFNVEHPNWLNSKASLSLWAAIF